LGIELGDGEVFPTIYPNGGEEGIVGLVEASEKILDKLFLIDWPAYCGQLICVALHLVEELLRRHVVLPRPCEGDAEIRDPCSGLGGKHRLDPPQTSAAVSIPMVVMRMSGERVLTRKERIC
jgi:hypothetical protein